MKKTIIIIAIAALILTISGKMEDFFSILKTFFTKWENFSASPYWDVSRWSWGYGTKVPGSIDSKYNKPTGTISREQAWKDTTIYVNNDFTYLNKLITRKLKPQQWAALLSFSYNMGVDDADNLVNNINTNNDYALQTQWMKYIYINSQPSDYQKQRRSAEWQLWAS